ncbi:MAG TPA: protein kinase, partial [Pyrinomonadaceae bacterium]
MSYCHECGSEVAKDDVYCPFCGIALHHASGVSTTTVATPDDSLPYEATQIDVPFESPIEPFKGDEEVVIEDVSLPAMPKEFDSGAHSVDSLLKSDTSENIAFNTEDSIGIEANLPTGEIPSQPTFASSPAEFFEQTEIESSETVSEAPREIGESNFELVPAIADETSVEQPAPPVIENQTPVQDFDSTIPYTPADLAQQEAIASKPAENQAAAPQKESAPAESENQIQPPVTPLAEGEEEESLPPTLISTPLPPFEEKVPEAFISAPQNQPSAEKSENQISEPIAEASVSGSEKSGDVQGRPYTSPNVNSIDTGGKKAKLKTLSEGTVLNGRYEIVRKIGGGGMGAVYLASDKNLGGVLRAVKEMVQSYIEDSQQEKAINDFKRESMILSTLDHTSIPTIYDYFYDDAESRFYLVMKYISGGDLAARLRSSPEGRVDEASVTEWAIQVADVLD